MKATLSDITVNRRGKTILGPVSFDLEASGVTMVLGPNGSGKTTLLKVLHGVERTSGGTLDWDAPKEETHSAQAYVFQTPIMLRRTVRQNLAFPLQLSRTSKPEIAEKVAHWADRIGLTSALERAAPRLSGGEKQKLAIGRALIRSPKVLFLDEPCANLDGRSTREIEALLQDAQSNGTRIIMTTHDIGQAKRLASDVLFLLNAKLHDQGRAPEFFTTPGTPETQAFLQGDIVE